MSEIRVLIVEDDPQQLGLLKDTIDSDTRFTTAGCASTHETAKQQIDTAEWDVLLLDLRLHNESTLDLVNGASAQGAVVVHTVYGNEETVIEAICSGATGYLVKESNLINLADQIESAFRGETPISSAVAGYLFKRLRGKSDEKEDNRWQLTARELEVLELLARGYTYREAAEALDITFNTVAFHTKQIYEKLRVNSRSAAVFQAMQDGIISI